MGDLMLIKLYSFKMVMKLVAESGPRERAFPVMRVNIKKYKEF